MCGRKINNICFQVDLSHNKFSFLSRHTFPSNKYIPYKLKEIDLSYNLMPVLTMDITVGTSKVEKLNLSHNAISDIRKGKYQLNIYTGPSIFFQDVTM